MKVKGDLEGLAPNLEHVLRITEFGDIQGDLCSEIGEEFNPLAPEPKKTYKMNEWGFWDEFMTNPTNEDGRIDAIEANSDGKVSFRQEELLQNLSGEDSLLGRGLYLSMKDSDIKLGCCTIGRDIYREPEVTQ